MRYAIGFPVALLLASLFTSASTPAGAETVLRMSSMFPTTFPHIGDSAKNFAKTVEDVSGGSLKFELYEPGKLTPRKNTFKAVVAGEIDAMYSTPILERKLEATLELFGSMPFGPPINALIGWMQKGGGNELMGEIYEKQGIKSVFCGVMAPQVFGWFPKEIHSMSDIQGLRMRFVGMGAQVLQRVGVDVKRMPGSKIVASFQAGEIDAAELATPLIDYNMGLHKWAKYYYFPGWHQPATLFNVLINPDVWRGLSPTQQAQVEAACQANLMFGIVDTDTRQTDVLEKLEAEGVEIKTLPDDVLAGLRESWDGLTKELTAKDPVFAKVWGSLTTFLEKDAKWRDLAYRRYALPRGPS